MYVQYLYVIHITATAVRCSLVGGGQPSWWRLRTTLRPFHRGSVSFYQFLNLVTSIDGMSLAFGIDHFSTVILVVELFTKLPIVYKNKKRTLFHNSFLREFSTRCVPLNNGLSIRRMSRFMLVFRFQQSLLLLMSLLKLKTLSTCLAQLLPKYCALNIHL